MTQISTHTSFPSREEFGGGVANSLTVPFLEIFKEKGINHYWYESLKLCYDFLKPPWKLSWNIIWLKHTNLCACTLCLSTCDQWMQISIHAMCLCPQAYISAKLGWIRGIKVSMESGEHARHFWAHNSPGARKLVCLHAICFVCTGPYLI